MAASEQNTSGVSVNSGAAEHMTGAEPKSRSTATSRNLSTMRVLRVLTAFACVERTFGVSELSRQLGMTKNLVFRALSTLLEEGLVMRDASGNRYQLSYGIVGLLNHSIPPPDFRTLAEPYILELRELAGQTVHLSVKIGDHATVIDGVEGTGPVLVRAKLGVPIPLHASPGSRAILASLSDEEIADYIKRKSPLERFTEFTLTEPAQLWKEVREVRARGYAIGLKDYNRGSNAVAFPICDSLGRPHGAINVGGPVSRFTMEQTMALLPRIGEIVADLQRKAVLYYVD